MSNAWQKLRLGVVLFLMILLAACQPDGEVLPPTLTTVPVERATAVSPASATANTTPEYVLARLEEALHMTGLLLETADSSPPQSLTPPIQNVRVNEEFIAVRVYADTATAVSEAAWIAPGGEAITNPDPVDPNREVTVVYEWVATPHWFQSENLIVFYAGDTQSILNGLEIVLGTQFAGRETFYPTESVPMPTTTAVPPEPELPAATPAATSTYFLVAGWSPDSRWLAYWASTQEDIDAQLPAIMPGGTLHFHEAITGETCAMSQFHTTYSREASVQWPDDGSVIVAIPEGTYRGRPCQPEPFTLLTDYQPPQIEQSDPALSPDGRYRILSAQTASENGILTYETQLVSADDGQELAAVTWQIDERLGDYSGWLGGEWVSPTQFIIYETWQQGPLLLDVDRGVVPILTDLLSLDTIPSMADEAGFSLTARPVFSAETNAYHLLISGVGLEGNFPQARLYHSESGLVETLPYPHIYWPLGQGTWIFLDSRPIVDGYETYEIWMRRLEVTGNEWQLLANDVDGILWSENKTEIVFTQRETAVIWQSFPGGETLGQWETSPYWTLPVAFSPDGRFVVTTGNNPGEMKYGLFIFNGK